MGAAASQPRAPWEGANGAQYPPDVIEQVKNISSTPLSFLEPLDPHADQSEFDLTEAMPRMQGAVFHDARLNKWLPKLVPKRVSEVAFWRNYFSRVDEILARSTALPVVEGEEADEAVEEEQEEQDRVRDADDEDSAAPVVPLPAQPANGVKGGDAEASTGTSSVLVRLPGGASASLVRKTFPVVPEPDLEVDEDKLYDPIRWGFIGAGTAAETALEAFRAVAGSEVVAVTSRTRESAKRFAEAHGIPRSYATVDALLADPDINAVYVASPPGTHARLAVKISAAGLPCLVEAPIARSHEECVKMRDEFYRSNIPMYVAFPSRRLPKFVVAKQLIERHIGDVSSVSYAFSACPETASGSWRTDATHSGGGLFMHYGSQALDAIDFLVGQLGHAGGDALRHRTTGGDVAVETHVAMTFRTSHGALGTASWDFAAPVEEDRLVVRGTLGQVSLSVFGADSPVLTVAGGASADYPCEFPSCRHTPLVEAIVLQLRGAQVPKDRLSTGESASRTAVLVDHVLRRFYRSRSDNFWTRPNTWESGDQLKFQHAAAGHSLRV